MKNQQVSAIDTFVHEMRILLEKQYKKGLSDRIKNGLTSKKAEAKATGCCVKNSKV